MTRTIRHRRALARRGAVAAVSALTLLGAGVGASVATAEGPAVESAAVEAACKTASERAAETFRDLGPLSEHVSSQGHSSRVRHESKGKGTSKGKGKGKGKGKAHHHGKQVSHKAAVTVPGWTTALTDSIGPYTMVFLVDAEGRSNCLMGPNPAEGPGGMGGSSGGEENAEVSPDQVAAFDLGMSRARDFKPFSYVEGRAGSAVGAVNFTLRDGGHVSAEMAHGWFLAFWEGMAHAATIEVVSAGGTSAKAFYDPSANE